MMAMRGFTLLEVLIAMAIFSIVGLASFELLRSVRNIDRVTDRQTESYQGLVRTLALMDRDFIQLRYREIRDELGDRNAAVAVNEGYYPIEFTRQGWNNPLQRARSELQRVGYVVEGDSLERHVWFVLDRAQDSEPVSQVLMAGVDALTTYLVSLMAIEWSLSLVMTFQSYQALSGSRSQLIPGGISPVCTICLFL